jgi:Mg2+ and Co2+ transporter CorA
MPQQLSTKQNRPWPRIVFVARKGDPDKARAHEVFTGIQKDLEFLVNKLEDLEKPITTAREQIIEQMSLAQGQRALVLTIAAAFFIPLSFVAVSPINIL